MSLTNREIEDIAARVLVGQDAAGVLVLIITKQERAEVVAALTDALDPDALPGMIHKLADNVAGGAGVPVGRHLQKINAAIR